MLEKCCKSESDNEQEEKYKNVPENIHDVTRRVFVSNPHNTSEQEQDDFWGKRGINKA